MNLRLPTRFVLLDKAIATVGAVGIDLYPDFNVFEVAKPYARSLMLERFTPRAGRRPGAPRERSRSPRWPPSCPTRCTTRSSSCAPGEIEFGFVHKGLDDFMHKLDVLANRLVIALVTTGGLIGSSLIGIFAKTGPHILGLNVVSALGFVASGVLGVWLLWGVVRSGRI